MAANFRITVRRQKNSFHLQLKGKFDGMSACELLGVLKKIPGHVNKAIIHTGELTHIDPFGQDSFQKNLYTLKTRPLHLVFAGTKSDALIPERANVGQVLFCRDHY